MRSLIVCTVLAALATGCASTPKSEDASGPASRDATRAVAAGETLTVGGQDVRVERLYRAASGRRCARVRTLSGGGERVACRGDDGRWALRRSLSELDRSAPERPSRRASATDAVRVLTAPGESSAGLAGVRSATLRDGETLWRFAARTTGDATLWREIAALNELPDPDRVRAGSTLRVPAPASSARAR